MIVVTLYRSYHVDERLVSTQDIGQESNEHQHPSSGLHYDANTIKAGGQCDGYSTVP